MQCCDVNMFFDWIDHAINDPIHTKNVNIALQKVNLAKYPPKTLRMSAIGES